MNAADRTDGTLWRRGFQCELMDVFTGIVAGTGRGFYNLTQAALPNMHSDMLEGAMAAKPLATTLREHFDTDPVEFMATHRSYSLAGLDVARAFCAVEASNAWDALCRAEDAHIERALDAKRGIA